MSDDKRGCCATCMHWEPPQKKWEKMGTCMTSSPGISGFSPTSGKRLMEAMCDEDRGYLLTDAEFGCVQWEEER